MSLAVVNYESVMTTDQAFDHMFDLVYTNRSFALPDPETVCNVLEIHFRVYVGQIEDLPLDERFGHPFIELGILIQSHSLKSLEISHGIGTVKGDRRGTPFPSSRFSFARTLNRSGH